MLGSAAGGRMERPSWTLFRLAATLIAALAPAAVPVAQQAPAANAEHVRLGYDTYRTLARTSPYRNRQWQFLGPTNISGRATDVEVADTPEGRRIYVAY